MNARERAAQRAAVDAATRAGYATPLPPPPVAPERLELCAVCWWMGHAYRDGKVWRVGPHHRWSTGNVCPGAHGLPLGATPTEDVAL